MSRHLSRGMNPNLELHTIAVENQTHVTFVMKQMEIHGNKVWINSILSIELSAEQKS